MKLLLSCDEYCYIYKGKYYLTKTGILFIDRYSRVFDEIRLAIRTKVIFDEYKISKFFEINNDRVEIFELPFFQGPKQLFRKIKKLNKLSYKACQGCDIAIFRLPSTVAFFCLKKWKKTKKIYATEIVFDCYDALKSSTGIINKIIWKILHNWQVDACKSADGVACVTQKYLQQRYFSKKKNSISTHYSTIELKPDFFYKPRKFPKKKEFTLIHIANQVYFNSRKGHNQILQIVSSLKKLGLVLNIVFVGENYQNGFEKLNDYATQLSIKSQIKFTGFISSEELRKELINADLAILPTKAEGLPRVVIESMAAGLPCITSPVSGNPELINSEFLVNFFDIEGMVSICQKLLTNKYIYEKESLENYYKSREYCSDILNPRRTNFYKELRKKVELMHL